MSKNYINQDFKIIKYNEHEGTKKNMIIRNYTGNRRKGLEEALFS